MACYVVCFDISDDGARDRVGKRLLHYGERVQKSVFEIQLESAEGLQALREALREEIDRDDKIHFYRLCLSCRRASMDGDNRPIAAFPAVMIV